jgi:acyl-CoA synthetase (AMP-forming)/AMP-acid ligase II
MTVLHDMFDDAARRWPDRQAVSDADGAYTFAGLVAAGRRAAGWLHAAGVGRGDRVVVVVRSGTAVPVLLYATSRLGAIFCLLHEQTTDRSLAHVVADAEPALVVTDPAPALASTVDGPAADVLPVDPVLFIYTSGTTAEPKAVVSTHDQVVFAARAIQSRLSYRTDDVVYCPLPLSFDYGMYQLFLGALSGAHVRVARTAETAQGLLRTLHGTGATVLAAVPPIAHTLARLLTRDNATAPPLRLMTNTGAAMPPQVLAALRAAVPTLRVQLMFGLTECKRATIMPPDGDLDRPGSCGLPLPGTEVYAADPAGVRLPAGVPGELVVRGPNVMAGYWRRPELTERRFPRADGLFPHLRTGDHGWVDDDGYVYFLGRDDDVYKERGFRVSTVEVEAAARRVPGVEHAAVLPPRDGRPALLVAVGSLPADDVLVAMRAEIEEYKIPQRCVVLDTLPLTRNGKVDRRRLAEVARG